MNVMNYKDLTDEQVIEADNIFSDLSPENLTCDGELSRNQVIQKRNSLLKRLKAVEAAVGFSLNEVEIYKQRKLRGI